MSKIFFMIWWHYDHGSIRKSSFYPGWYSELPKQTETSWRKISNSRRSVDSVVWSKSRLTFSFLELLGGLINPHIVLAPPSLVFHTVSWLFWPGLKCCFAPTWACFDDTPLRWITAPTPQHGHAPLHSTLFDSKSSQLKIYSIDCNTIHYNALNCTSSSLANPEHSHLNIFLLKRRTFAILWSAGPEAWHKRVNTIHPMSYCVVQGPSMVCAFRSWNGAVAALLSFKMFAHCHVVRPICLTFAIGGCPSDWRGKM